MDETPFELGLEYQPLSIGEFWIYSVDETQYLGENDSEEDSYFYKDLIRSTYLDEGNELVYIVERSKSYDQENWSIEKDYTLKVRNNTLIRTINNQPVVVLVFPPKSGTLWDGNSYRESDEDDFEIIELDNAAGSLRVLQSMEDDLVTYRDNRYEVFQKGVGLVEEFKEVLTYCSRNDCLGDQLIDSGSKVHLILTEHGIL
ncbi:hypothetical protein ALPR1_12995 [Algoriphagus machipongonensis]|uniref:Uncharacterized protein n=1 Tax=Algoriphagus machipongonensis TaxID=388413 RepID=A3HTH0_9BACT|nr:hypothetical protein ALPR1_12995 [Algoriphagus machipongonensis]